MLFIIKLFQFLVFLIIQIPLIPIAIIGIIPMLYKEMNIAGGIISIVQEERWKKKANIILTICFLMGLLIKNYRYISKGNNYVLYICNNRINIDNLFNCKSRKNAKSGQDRHYKIYKNISRFFNYAYFCFLYPFSFSR